MKKVVFRYKEEMMIGGPPRHFLKFMVGDQIMEDVDILKSDGVIEHGFRFENILGISCDFGKVSTVDEIVEKLELIIKDLKKEAGCKK